MLTLAQATGLLPAWHACRVRQAWRIERHRPGFLQCLQALALQADNEELALSVLFWGGGHSQEEIPFWDLGSRRQAWAMCVVQGGQAPHSLSGMCLLSICMPDAGMLPRMSYKCPSSQGAYVLTVHPDMQLSTEGTW